MITAHSDYVQSHQDLFTASTFEEIERASRSTVESYLENRRIWDELNHFKNTGQILGRHPIFDWTARLEAIRRMKIGDLVKLKIRLDNNLVRTRAAVRRQPGHVNTADRLQRIDTLQKELTEVNRMLNL